MIISLQAACQASVFQ